jgi:hypothetical protein
MKRDKSKHPPKYPDTIVPDTERIVSAGDLGVHLGSSKTMDQIIRVVARITGVAIVFIKTGQKTKKLRTVVFVVLLCHV